MLGKRLGIENFKNYGFDKDGDHIKAVASLCIRQDVTNKGLLKKRKYNIRLPQDSRMINLMSSLAVKVFGTIIS